MTFCAAICGLSRLGPPRLGLVGIEAPDLDSAIVEAHRVARKDHPFRNGFVAYGVSVSAVSRLPDRDDPVPYTPVRTRREEFNPDRNPDREE